MPVPSASRWATRPGNWDPLHASITYPGDAIHGLPVLLPCPAPPLPPALTAWPGRKRRPPSNGLHCFVDDYRFEPLWKSPARFTASLLAAPLLLTPDFSLYDDWPLPLQLWNAYRSRWIARWLQDLGARVVPAVSWAGPASFPFAFTGIPRGSAVAVTTTGRTRFREAFAAGYRAMVDVVHPCLVVLVGDALPPELAALAPTHTYPADALAAVRERAARTLLTRGTTHHGRSRRIG